MALQISAVERDVARQQAKVADMKRRITLLEAGTPEHVVALCRLETAECFLCADTKLLAYMRRRLALFRALGAESCMSEPVVID
jgi:hypothetical protein